MANLKKNFFYNSILAVSQVLYPLISFPYVARVLNPEGIGILSFVDSFCRYFMLIAALGIPIYGIREIAKVKKSKNGVSKLFSELLLIHIISTILISLVFGILVFNIEKLRIHKELYFVGIVGVISNVFIVEWYFQGIEKFKFITTRNLFIRLFSTLLIFICVKESTDLIKYYVIMTSVSVLNAVVNFTYAAKELKIHFIFDIKNILKKHFKPLLYIFVSLAFISIYTLLDIIILGLLSDNRAVGIYSTAMKIAKIPIIFISALSTVLLPKLSEYSLDENRLVFIGLINKSIKIIYFFSIPVMILIIGLADNIINIFVGYEYFESYYLLQFFSVLSLLLGISNICGFQILTTLSKDKYFTYCVGIGMITSILLNFLLIPRMNFYGAAIANILSEVIVTYLTYFFAKKIVDINLNFLYFIKQIFVSIPLILLIILSKYFISSDLFIIVSVSSLSLLYFAIIQFYLLRDEIVVNLNVFLKRVI